MKNPPHFREGPELFFGFKKRGVGGLFCAQRQEERPRFYLSSFAMRWTVPSPVSSAQIINAAG
jgi:hypothetical protein